jgi:hypothetical protein
MYTLADSTSRPIAPISSAAARGVMYHHIDHASGAKSKIKISKYNKHTINFRYGEPLWLSSKVAKMR